MLSTIARSFTEYLVSETNSDIGGFLFWLDQIKDIPFENP